MGSKQQRTTLLLSVDKVGDRFVDHQPTGTVADLVARLVSQDGLEVPEGAAITVDRTGSPLVLEDRLDESDLRSGDFIRFVDGVDVEPTAYVSVPSAADGAAKDVPATLDMLSGPKAGEAFDLKPGINSVGRVAANDVSIVDPGISRNHGSIIVDGNQLTIVDNGSTNGIMVDGTLITEATPIQSGQQILLGQSLAAISLREEPTATEPEEPLPLVFEPRNRSNHPYEGTQVLLPRPPDPETRGRRREFLSGRQQHKTEKDHFDRSVATLTERMSTERDLQKRIRLDESPSLSELIAAVPRRSMLWSTVASDSDAMVVRIGLGDVRSRTRFLPPGGGQQDLRTRLAELVEELSIIPRAPATVDLAECGSVGIHGPMKQVRGLAYALAGQLALTLGPDQLGLLAKPGVRSAEWDWLKWLPHGHFSGSLAGVTADDFEALIISLLDGKPLASGIERPPSVVVIIDDDRPLPVATLNRLLEEGPQRGLYSLLLSGETNGFDHPLGAMINVSPGSADLQRNGETEIGGISLETVDVKRLVSLVRNIAPLRYPAKVDASSPTGDTGSNGRKPSDDQVDGADEDVLTIGTFEFGGPKPPGPLPIWRLANARFDTMPTADDVPVTAAPVANAPATNGTSGTNSANPASPAAANPVNPVAANPTNAANPASPAAATAPVGSGVPEANGTPAANGASGNSGDLGVFAERTAPPASAATEPAQQAAPIPEEQTPAPTAPTMPKRTLDITSLPHAQDDARLVLGTVSAPGLPSAAVFALNLAHDGVLAIGGPSGSGKTTALRSVAVAAGLVRVPEEDRPLVCYLDGRDGLGDLDGLDHVNGGAGSDLEHAQSVAVDLERLVAERTVMLDRGDGPPADFAEHRKRHPGAGLRRFVVLIDDVKAVRAMFDAEHPGRFGKLFDSILNDGQRIGLHLVFSANERSDVGEENAAKVGRWLMLGDSASGGPRPPGRAVVGKSEVRFATAEIASVSSPVSSQAEPVTEAEQLDQDQQGAA